MSGPAVKVFPITRRVIVGSGVVDYTAGGSAAITGLGPSVTFSLTDKSGRLLLGDRSGSKHLTSLSGRGRKR